LSLLAVGLVLGGSSVPAYFYNNTADLRSSGVFVKVFDLAYWWDLNFSSVLVVASPGAEWRFDRVEGAVLDYAVFWEDCSYCDSDAPPPVKNRNTLYEDLILRVSYVGGRWVVRVLYAQGGFGHEVYVNGSLLYRKPWGYVGEPGVSGSYVGRAIALRLVSLGDSRADSEVVFDVGVVPEPLACAAAFGLGKREAELLVGAELARVRRGAGAVAFVFKNGSVVAVPLVFEANAGPWGRLVLANPCGVGVNWTVAVYVYNGTRPRGRPLEISLSVPPYGVVPLYFDGVAEVGGFYRFGYRVYATGVYRWGNYTFSVRRGLVVENGSIVNWLWGAVEQLWGVLTRDKCVEARGRGGGGRRSRSAWRGW